MNKTDLKRVKKMVTKGSIRDAKKILSNVPDERVFYVSNGKVLKNLKDMAKELEKMSLNTFHTHVNPYKNDFANWVNDVIGDSVLSDEIRKLKTRKSMTRHVNMRIKQLKG